MAAEETVQVGANLVSLALTEGVALSTSCLEETSTLLCVSCRKIYRQLKCSLFSKVVLRFRRKPSALPGAGNQGLRIGG